MDKEKKEAFQEEVKEQAKAWSFLGTPSWLRWYEASWVQGRNRQGILPSHKNQPKEPFLRWYAKNTCLEGNMYLDFREAKKGPENWISEAR